MAMGLRELELKRESAMGPGCVKTLSDFLYFKFAGSDGFFGWFSPFLRFHRLLGAFGPVLRFVRRSGLVGAQMNDGERLCHLHGLD